MGWIFYIDWEDLIRKTSLDILSVVSIFSIFYVLLNYSRVLRYEIEINKVEKEKQQEIYANKAVKGSDKEFLIGTEKLIEIKYKDKLYYLNRKRKSILERLPFFKI